MSIALVDPITYTVDHLSNHDNYAGIASGLYGMLSHSIECTDMQMEYVSMEQQLASIEDSRNHNNAEDNRYIYHSDHLGSSSFLTDTSGTPTQHLQYLPFGEPFIEQRTVTEYYTPYTFSAKERDSETGYSYFGARYYNAHISVWLSVDPMADKAPGWTPYRYGFHNPIRHIDANGLFESESEAKQWAKDNGIKTGWLRSHKVKQLQDGTWSVANNRKGYAYSKAPFSTGKLSFYGDKENSVMKSYIINAGINKGNINSTWSNIQSWWKNKDLFFSLSLKVTVGPQLKSGFSVNNTKMKTGFNIASVTLFEGGYEQISSDSGSKSYNLNYIGKNSKAEIQQGASIPFLGFEQSFETMGEGHIPGSIKQSYTIGPINSESNGTNSLQLQYEYAFIIGVQVNAKFGKK